MYLIGQLINRFEQQAIKRFFPYQSCDRDLLLGADPLESNKLFHIPKISSLLYAV